MNAPLMLRLAPQALTGLRLALAPAVYTLILAGRGEAAAIVLALAVLTDAVDGPLARRLGVSSDAGAQFDVWADFVLIEAVFIAFAQAGSGPWSIPLLAALAFFYFLGTARFTPRLYDPVGRNVGGVLMGAGLAVLAMRDLLMAEAAYLVALAALAVTLAARTAYLARSLRRSAR